MSGFVLFVVSSAGENFQRVADNPVDQAVAVVDSAAPESAEFVFQWLRFSDAVKSIAAFDVANELIDPFQRFLSCVCQYI